MAQAAGKIKETAGKVFGSKEVKAEGIAQQAKGKAVENTRKTGILSDAPDHCAVLDIAKLARGDILPLIVSSLDLNPRLQTGRGFSRFLFID